MPVRRGRGGRAVHYLRIYIRLDSGCAAAGDCRRCNTQLATSAILVASTSTKNMVRRHLKTPDHAARSATLEARAGQ